MALQLQQRVSQYQERLSNLSDHFVGPRTHQILSGRGDQEACPLILRERTGELNAWNVDFGEWQGAQNDKESSLASRCLDEVSRILGLIENLFDLDAGEQEIDGDQKTRYSNLLYDAFKELATSIHDLRALSSSSAPGRARSTHLETAFSNHEELKSYFHNQMRNPMPAPLQSSPLPTPNSLSLQKHHRGTSLELKHGTVDFLWTTLPIPRELRETPDWKDRKDGVVVDEAMLEKARKVLKAYYEAWEGLAMDRADEMIKEMPKIAITLNTIRLRTYFDKFLSSRLDDSFFPFELDVLNRDIFNDPVDAQRFHDEQYRIVSRNWYGGDRIDLGEGEPIPFKIDQIFDPGSFSSVQRVKNVFTNKSYAIKYPNEKASGAECHMENEIRLLRDVCNKERVPHIVRVEKVFSRGREFGVLMSPAATTNLQRILERFVQDIQVRDYLRREFLKGFGCLSHMLCYMHNDMNTRHCDIKPQNILFDWPKNESQYTRFLWSDFGLAKKFSIQEGSATSSLFNRGTEKYVAPEVLSDDTKHGRSADVFSFGCVMFEILGCILGGQYSTSREAPNTDFPKRFHPHHQNIEQMHAYLKELIDGQERQNLEHLVLAKWLNRKLKVDGFLSKWYFTTRNVTRADKCLTPLLDLTKRMTNKNPQYRPKIDEVVVELATMHYQGLDVFCSVCFDEVKTGYREKRAFMHRGEKRKSWRHFWSASASQPLSKARA